MAAQIVVEMTGDEAKLWRAQQKILQQQMELELKYRGIGAAAGAAGDSATDAMGKAGAAVQLTAKETNQLERVMLKLGGESAKNAQQMELLKKAHQAGTLTTQQYRQAVEALLADQTQLAAQQRVSAEQDQRAVQIRKQQQTVEQAYTESLNQHKRELAGLVAAGKLSREEAAASLKQMKLNDPEIVKQNKLASDAAQIRRSNMTAEQRYAQSLSETRKQVQQLVAAGHLSQQEAENHLKLLEKQNPELKKLAQNTNQVQSAGKAVFSEVAGMVTGFLTVTKAIDAVKVFLAEERERGKNSLANRQNLAEAQSELIQNVPNMSDEEINNLLGKTDAIAVKNKVDKKTIVQATAAAWSASGGDLEASLNAVDLSAGLNRLTPDEIPATAMRMLGVQKATGVESLPANLGILATTQETARPSDKSVVAENVAKIAAVSRANFAGPELEVATQGAALWSHLTQVMDDAGGSESLSAGSLMLSKMSQFFTSLDTKLLEAQDEVERLSAKKDLSTAETRKLKERKEFVQQATAVASQGPAAVDTPFEANAAIANNSALNREFWLSSFGEKYSGALRQLSTAGTVGNEQFTSTGDKISSSEEIGNRIVERAQGFTPEIRQAVRIKGLEGSSKNLSGMNAEKSERERVRQIYETKMPEYSVGGVRGLLDSIAFHGTETGMALEGDTSSEESVSLLKLLQTQKKHMQSAGLDLAYIRDLDETVQSVKLGLLENAQGAVTGETNISESSIRSALESSQSIATQNEFDAKVLTGPSRDNALETARLMNEVANKLQMILDQKNAPAINADSKPNNTKSYSPAARKELAQKAG